MKRGACAHILLRPARRFPSKAVDQVEDIFLQEFLNRPERVGVGCRVEIQSAPEKVPAGIAEEKLPAGGRVTPHFKIHAMNAIGRADKAVADGAGDDIVFIGQVKRVVNHPVKIICADGIAVTAIRVFHFVHCFAANDFIAEKNTGMITWKIDVDPIRVFGGTVEIRAILKHLRVNGILKAIWEAFPLEPRVFPFREIDMEIAFLFWYVRRIA